jgi:hypothetical protein
MTIVKVTAIEWRERKLIRILFIDQSVKPKFDQRGTIKVKTGR